MNKTDVLNAIITELEAQLAAAITASKEAASYATDTEAKAETKWDTQGLEASYLAAGQAEQANSLAAAIGQLREFAAAVEPSHSSIRPGSLIECEIDGYVEWYFLAPVGGGLSIALDDIEVTVITPQAQLGAQLVNLQPGNTYTLSTGISGLVKSVS